MIPKSLLRPSSPLLTVGSGLSASIVGPDRKNHFINFGLFSLFMAEAIAGGK